MILRRGRTATLCVSEPPRTGKPLEITWDTGDCPVVGVSRAGESVDVVSTDPRLELCVTPGMASATHECEVVFAS